MKQHNALTALLLTMALLAASVVPAFAYSPVEPHSPYYETDSGKIDSAKAYVTELLKRGSDHFDTAGELRLRGLAASMDEAKAIAWEDHETASAYLSAFEDALDTIQPVKENADLVFPQEEVRMRRLLQGYFDKNEPGDEPVIPYNPVWEDFNGYRMVRAYAPMERPATYDLRVGGYIYHGENQYSPSETDYMVVNAKTVVDDADDPDKYVTTFEEGLRLGIIDADRLYEISKKEKFDFTIYRAGDFDHDGNVDVTDATLIQLYIVQNGGAATDVYSDFNNDGVTDVTDATNVQLFALSHQPDAPRQSPVRDIGGLRFTGEVEEMPNRMTLLGSRDELEAFAQTCAFSVKNALYRFDEAYFAKNYLIVDERCIENDYWAPELEIELEDYAYSESAPHTLFLFTHLYFNVSDRLHKSAIVRFYQVERAAFPEVLTGVKNYSFMPTVAYQAYSNRAMTEIPFRTLSVEVNKDSTETELKKEAVIIRDTAELAVSGYHLSGQYDDAFFEENALVVWWQVFPYYNNSVNVPRLFVSKSGDTVFVENRQKIPSMSFDVFCDTCVVLSVRKVDIPDAQQAILLNDYESYYHH